jgi:hypothetical protein
VNAPGAPADAADLAGWRTPTGDDPRAAELDARAAAARAYTAATLGRAETTDAARRLAAADRDPVLVQVIAAAGRFYQSQLTGSWVPGYLASRGLDAALLPTSPWKIGYAPASWTALVDHLRGRGFTDADMLTAGLAVNGRNGQLRDHFHDRLILPLRAEDGIATGFIGRRHPEAGHDHGPKYLNTSATRSSPKATSWPAWPRAGARSSAAPSPSSPKARWTRSPSASPAKALSPASRRAVPPSPVTKLPRSPAPSRSMTAASWSRSTATQQDEPRLSALTGAWPRSPAG